MTISRNLFLAALVTVAFPVVAGKTAEKAVAKTAEAAATTGFGTKVYNVVSWPFVTTASVATGSIDWTANTFGARRFANWLASGVEGDKGYVASFFTGKEQNTARLIAVFGTAAVVAAAYKAYQNFVAAQEDADADEYNFGLTEEDFDAEDAQ